MVARPGSYQSSCNAGELAPELHGNTGLKSYYSGLSVAVNIAPVPQGGFDLLPRTRYFGRLRRGLSLVFSGASLSSAALSAAGVALEWEFDAPRLVSVVDIKSFSASVVLASLMVLEAQDAATGDWIAVGGALGAPLAASPATRRMGFAPRLGRLVRGLRLRLIAAPPSPVSLVVAGLDAWAESASGLPVRKAFRFTYSRAEAYVGVMTPGHVDFWRNGLYVGCASVPHDASQIADVRIVQRQETALLFHADVAPRKLVRHGSDWSWSSSDVAWSNVPEVDFGGVYTSRAEKWEVYVQWAAGKFPTATADFGFVIEVDGEETSLISLVPPAGLTTGIDKVLTAAAIKSAVEDLAGIEAGVTVVGEDQKGNSFPFSVEFTGALNAGNNYHVSGRIVTITDGALTASRLVKGKKGGEAVMSATRGWPSTACFYQERLILAGFRSKGSAFLASRTGEYFDLNVELQAASGAILANLDTDGAEAILHILGARHLCNFTDFGEYFAIERALDRTKPPNIVRSSTNGVSHRVAPVEQEGSLIYVSREETIIYSAVYSDQAFGYESAPISLLASHLINGDIVASALQKSTTATDAQRYFLPRGDGVMVVGLLVRNQDVTAFVRWITDGFVRDCIVDGSNAAALLVERVVDGEPDVFVEGLEDGLLFDAAVTVSLPVPGKVVSGADMHEGATVWAMADGHICGPFQVVGGSFTLADDATQVTFGRWTPPQAKGLPLVRDVAPHQVLDRPTRIHTLQLDVIGTTSLAVGANGRPARDVSMGRARNPVDVPLQPYTGELSVVGLQGFSSDGIWEITQKRPGSLQVRNITVQAKV